MEWYQIIGVPAILSTIIPFFITRYYKKKDNKEEKLEQTTEEFNQLKTNYDIFVEKYEGKIEKLENSINDALTITNTLKDSSKNILRDRIVYLYNHYYEDKKYMPIYARESLSHMYNSYRELEGDGIIESLVKKMFELPTNSDDRDSILDNCNNQFSNSSHN